MFGFRRSFTDPELEVVTAILRTSNDPASALLIEQAVGVERVRRSREGSLVVVTAEYVRGELADVFETVRSKPVTLDIGGGSLAEFQVDIAAGGMFHALRILPLPVGSTLPDRWGAQASSLESLSLDLMDYPEPNLEAAGALASELGLSRKVLNGLVFPQAASAPALKVVPASLEWLLEIADGFRIGQVEIFNVDALVDLGGGDWNFALDHSDDARFILRKDGSVHRTENYQLADSEQNYESADIRSWLRELLA